MEPIALFLTDTHLKDKNQELVYNIFEQAIEICKENDIRVIFHGGDFFTNRNSITLTLITQALRIADMLKKEGITLYIIPGNHDKTDQDSERSYLDMFKHRKNIKVIREESCLELKGITFAFLPFFTDSYNSRLSNVKSMAKDLENDTNILITHIAINGVRNNDGTVVEDCNEPKAFKFWDKVWVGHYHDSQSFKNVFYTGSAYQANFGERLDDKGFHLVYDNGSLDFIPSKYTRYIKVSLDVNDDIETELEMYGDKGDHVRFVFSGDQTDIHKIDRQKLDALGIDVKFELNNVNEEILKIENGDFASMSKKNVIGYFREYCELQEIEKSKVGSGLKILIKE